MFSPVKEKGSSSVKAKGSSSVKGLAGESVRELGRSYNVSPNAISRVRVLGQSDEKFQRDRASRFVWGPGDVKTVIKARLEYASVKFLDIGAWACRVDVNPANCV